MEKIGFKIWNSDLAIGEEGNALVSSFLRKASEVIETEINEDGGIGGKQMTITSERVVKGEEGIKKVLNSVRNTPDILFTHGHVMAGSNQKFVDGLDLDSHFLFTTMGGELHPNKFNISRVKQVTKSTAIARLLENVNTAARVILFTTVSALQTMRMTLLPTIKVRSNPLTSQTTKQRRKSKNILCLF